MTPDYLKTEDGEVMVYGDGAKDEMGNIIPAGSPQIRPRAYVTDPVTGQSHVLYDSMSREQADELRGAAEHEVSEQPTSCWRS